MQDRLTEYLLEDKFEHHHLINESESILYISIKKDKSLIGYLCLRNLEQESNYTENRIKNTKLLIPYIQELISTYYAIQERLNQEATIIEDLKSLKDRRDGDYFLISILLDALQNNSNHTSNIQTEFYLEQKIKFHFRKWSREIGGDLCKTDTIYLNDGHAYTVVLNGDAMGKSIQGAGGAIVLGVVFDAILSRAKLRRRVNYNVFPEIWLKDTFLDVHSVFSSFQGSMFSSFFLGLVHSETGNLYYINAEHPPTVLYRNGKAEYIEKDSQLYKLGTPDQEDNISIRVFQLKNGDTIITGSDGKDDIIIGKDKSGIEQYLEDENIFLQIIEDTNTELHLIKEKLNSIGTIKDDISILKFTYTDKHKLNINYEHPKDINSILKESEFLLERNKYKEALDKLLDLEQYYEAIPDLARLLGKIYFEMEDYLKSIQFYEFYETVNPEGNLFILSDIYLKFLGILCRIRASMKDYPKAIESMEEYLYIRPSDNKMLYHLSVMYKESGILEKAADVGERLYLREPKYLDNLLNLSHIYLLLKVHDRAKKMIDRAIYLEPENEKILSIYEKIRGM